MNRTEKKRLFRFAVDYFIASLNTVTKGTTKYKCNDADVKSWDIFCEHFGERVAESFIHEYVQYGMNSWFYNGFCFVLRKYGRKCASHLYPGHNYAIPCGMGTHTSHTCAARLVHPLGKPNAVVRSRRRIHQ